MGGEVERLYKETGYLSNGEREATTVKLLHL